MMGLRSPLRIALSVPLLASALLLPAGGRVLAQEPFLRGDANVDGRISVSDALTTRRWLFIGGPIQCGDAVDFDDDGRTTIADEIRTLHFLFLGGDPPAAPYPNVGVDPTESDEVRHAVCPSYDVVAPEETDDVVVIEDVAGAPGEPVEVPVLVDSARDIEAFQLVIAYDPASFTPAEEASDIPSEVFGLGGTFYDGAGFSEPYASVTVDAAGGLMIVCFIPDLVEEVNVLPARTTIPAFNLRGTIPEDAPPGSSSLTPVNLEGGYGPAGLKNELTYKGDARWVSVEPRLFGAVLQIVGDQIFFRGDSNGDDSVDISDATHTLHYLFLGGERPACLDAADANDDGRLDIADPVSILGYLFLDGKTLPPPLSAPGRDPTPDDLDC